MIYTFESHFSAKIEDFIAQKNALGFGYQESSRLLRDFDRFCLAHFPDVDLLTEEQVNYAINNYLFDWKQAAVICANQYIDTLWMTPKDLKDEILFLGFTMEEALYAIDHCDIDWNSCAKWIAKDIFRGNEYGREEILEYLQNICEFTFEQALWGVENGEFDYNKETNNNTSNNSSLLETTSTTSEKQVWISDSGSKYHNNAGCSNMKNPSQIPLSKAKQLGYEPCKRCH